jgi:hypothetical protein
MEEGIPNTTDIMIHSSDEHDPKGTTSTIGITSNEIDVPSSSPPDHVANQPQPTDSMVTVRLSDPSPGFEQSEEHGASEPPALKIDTDVAAKRLSSSSVDVPAADAETPTTPFQDVEDQQEQEQEPPSGVVAKEMGPSSDTVSVGEEQQLLTSNEAKIDGAQRTRSDSSTTSISEGSDGVDWEELERNEEQEPRDEGSDEVRNPRNRELIIE